MTHHLIITNHHTKFGKKWLSGSVDTEQTESDTRRKYHWDKHSPTFWTSPVTLTLNSGVQFSHRILQLMILYYQTKFGCKPISNLEDTTEIVIFWLYKPLLWPWHWTQWTNFSLWHSGLWCRITIPSLAKKGSVVQKISSKQTCTNILNRRCDLDFDRSNHIFPQDTLVYDGVLSNHVWFQTDQQLAVTLTVKIVNQVFCMTHCPMISHHHTRLGKKWLSGLGDTEQTRTELQMDRQTAAQTEKLFPIYPPPPPRYHNTHW